MLIHSLKSKILINLVVLLILSVLLTDYVIIAIIQNKLILQKITNGKKVLLHLTEQLQDYVELATPVFSDSSFVYAYIFAQPRIRASFGEYDESINLNIPFITQKALKNGKTSIFFKGDTWGVFWKQKKYLVLTVPFYTNQNIRACGTVVFELDDIYKILRTSQKYVAVYLFVNLLILLIFYYYRFSRFIFKPIHKIIKIAKEYSNTEQLDFAPEKRYYEFNELSSSLNKMVARIEADNEKLKKSLKLLQDANLKLKTTQTEMIRTEKLASIGRLSAGIAHEIGNPIGIVLGYLGLLRNRPLAANDSATQDYIERAEKEISRINEIIRQLLDFSRTSLVRCCPISIHALIRDVVKVMSEQPLMTDIKIESNFLATKDVVFADYNQMRQVLINLLINAADSIAASDNKTNGLVQLMTNDVSDAGQKTFKGKPTLRLMVIDNGTGISSKDLDNIFDPFYTTKDPGKGTGLGLSVSYTIIEQTGGTILADSEIGKGTKMIIYLPIHEDIQA